MFAKHRFNLAFVFAVFLGACIAPMTRASLIVAPNALATTDGNLFDQTPPGSTRPLRLLYIYDASQFAELSGPALLTAYTFRHDIDPGPSGPRVVEAQIYASTTTRPVTGLSTVFADNIGPNNTLVFSGTLTWQTDNLPGAGNTRQFDIVNQLMTPFLYDPSAGNLALDLRYFSTSGSSIRFDADTSPTINRLIGLGSATSTTGAILGSGLVTQFTFEPVPAPSTFTLTSLGTLGLLGGAWRRRQKSARN